MSTVAKDSTVESTCGHCGYCVRGISGLTCPECGSDLREVGILPPNYRRRAGPKTKMVLWTILLPIFAVLFSILLLNTVLPFSQTQKVSRTIFLQAPALSRTVLIFGSQRIWQPALMGKSPTPPDSLMLWEKQYNIFLNLDLKTGGFSYEKRDHSTVAQPSGFNGAVLADWFYTSGVNPADPQVLALCDQACSAINEISNGTANKFTTFNNPAGQQLGIAHPAFTFIVHDEPNPVVIVILSLLWIAVWIYGIRRISRKHHRGVVASAATGGG